MADENIVANPYAKYIGSDIGLKYFVFPVIEEPIEPTPIIEEMCYMDSDNVDGHISVMVDKFVDDMKDKKPISDAVTELSTSIQEYVS